MTFEEIKKGFMTHNFKLFLVGGAVRDQLMDIEPNDFDFATDATPKEMMNMPFKTIPTGIKFGTITFVIDGKHFEVTTFRKDVNTDGRHAEVKFTDSIIDDLSRRDFTINAIAKNIFTNEIIDPFNGHIDIENKTIRTVGSPEKRFKEDFLRILRALRFAVRFGFTIDFKTLKACNKFSKEIVNNVSHERIRMEIMKAAETDDFASFILSMRFTDILRTVIPEIQKTVDIGQNKFHSKGVFGHTLDVIKELDKANASALIKLAGLFHDVGKISTKTKDENGIVHFFKHDKIGANITESIMKNLKFSKKEIKFVSHLVRQHMRTKSFGKKAKNVSDKAIRKLNKVKHLDSLLILINADNKAHAEFANMPMQVSHIKKRIIDIQMKDKVEKVTVPINGNDLMMEFNLKPGKLIGTMLEFAEDIVLEDPNIDKDKLLNIIAREFIA